MDQESMRLQQELDELSKERERNRMDSQRKEFSKAMELLSARLMGMGPMGGGAPHAGAGGGPTAAGPTTAGVAGHPEASIHNMLSEKHDGLTKLAKYSEQQKTAISALNALPKDSALYKMQMNHLEVVTRMKFEMDRLTQEQRMKHLQEELEKSQV